MVVPAFNQNQTFNGGQMTDLPAYTGAFDGTSLLEMVTPGDVAEGINYSITLTLLASFLIGSFTEPTIIQTGATVGNPYAALTTDYRILLDKNTPSPSYVDIGSGSARITPVMVRDILGDAATNNITVSFTGTCDGLASPIVIDAAYGGYTFNPLPNGNWYLTNT